jgi:hypothetical protein
MFCMKRTGLAIWLVMLVMIIPFKVMADDFSLTPSLSVREEYNDNIFFEYADTVDDYITTINAGLEMKERTERMDLDLTGTVSPYFYADNSNWNDVDQNYLGKIAYQVNPLLGVNASANYNVSNRPDRDVFTTGLVQSNNRRKRQAYGLGVTDTLNEYSKVGFDVNYSQDKYDSTNITSEDQKEYGGTLTFSHNLNRWWEETTGRLNLGFDRSEFETSDTDNYTATIGLQHQFSPTITFSIDGGVQYTDATYMNLQSNEESNNTSFGGTGQATLTIQGELTTGSVNLRHSITPASGRGQTVQRTEGVLNLSRRLAEKLIIGFAAGYYHNQADKDEFSENEIDEDAYYVRPSIQWEIHDNFNLQAGYSFIYIDDHSLSNDRKQNMVYLQAKYGLPLFE